MSVRRTITIQLEDEPGLIEAAKGLNPELIAIKRLGKAEVLSRSMGIEQVHYDIYIGIEDEERVDSTIFQLGVCAGLAKLKLAGL